MLVKILLNVSQQLLLRQSDQMNLTDSCYDTQVQGSHGDRNVSVNDYMLVN